MRTKLHRLILFTILSLTLTAILATAEQEDQDYYTGTVIETTKDHLKVSKVLPLGKTEERVFVVTAQTKVEGRLRVRVRVSVRFVSGPNGDTATLVIIRTEPAKGKEK